MAHTSHSVVGDTDLPHMGS